MQVIENFNVTMNILITNDDGYMSKGLRSLVSCMRQFGNISVIAPKKPQSGQSMAVSLGFRQIAYKEIESIDGVSWAYLDATPASCVKFGINFGMNRDGVRPDVVISGINHGSNACTAACYSGTLGAVQEATLNGIPGIGVSLDTYNPDADFTAVEAIFPEMFRKLMASPAPEYGVFYNINFPELPADHIKGIKVGHMGRGHWEREFRPWDAVRGGEAQAEPGEEVYVMVGDFTDEPENDGLSDHRLLAGGYITLTAHNIMTTDNSETLRLRSIGIEK